MTSSKVHKIHDFNEHKKVSLSGKSYLVKTLPIITDSGNKM